MWKIKELALFMEYMFSTLRNNRITLFTIVTFHAEYSGTLGATVTGCCVKVVMWLLVRSMRKCFHKFVFRIRDRE